MNILPLTTVWKHWLSRKSFHNLLLLYENTSYQESPHTISCYSMKTMVIQNVLAQSLTLLWKHWLSRMFLYNFLLFYKNNGYPESSCTISSYCMKTLVIQNVLVQSLAILWKHWLPRKSLHNLLLLYENTDYPDIPCTISHSSMKTLVIQNVLAQSLFTLWKHWLSKTSLHNLLLLLQSLANLWKQKLPRNSFLKSWQLRGDIGYHEILLYCIVMKLIFIITILKPYCYKTDFQWLPDKKRHKYKNCYNNISCH